MNKIEIYPERVKGDKHAWHKLEILNSSNVVFMVEVWISKWFGLNGKQAEIEIHTDGSGFDLKCLSGIIFIDAMDFGALWKKAHFHKKIGSLSYSEQCVHIAEYLCEFFCKIPEEMLPENMSEDQVSNKNGFSMTIGALKAHIEKHNLPDDGVVFVERIEDFYFKRNNWNVLRKEGDSYYHASRWNANVEEEGEGAKKYSDAELESFKTQYHKTWSCVSYKDDDKNLYIDSHY